MSEPAPSRLDPVVLEAWQRLLRSHALIIRLLDAELQSSHDMTLSDYDVLVHLRDCSGGRLRMSELSDRALLTRSGMTRLVQGLAREGLVTRHACSDDARVSYVCLTPRGRELLAQARVTHHAGIHRLFAQHFTAAQMQQLGQLLGQLPGIDECDASRTGR